VNHWGLGGLVALIGCSAGPDDSGKAEPTDSSAETTGEPACEVVFSETIEAIPFVRWTAPKSASGHVTYGLTSSTERQTPSRSGSEQSHPILGLKAGSSYQVEAVTTFADGTTERCGPLEVTTPQPPAELKRFLVTVEPDEERTELWGGYILTTLIQTDTAWTVLLDQDGDYVWWYPMPEDAIVVTSLPSLDGAGVAWGEYDRLKQRDIGLVRQVRLDGTFTQTTRTYLGHHGFIEHDDGNLGWLALTFEEVPNPQAEKGGTLLLASDEILEAPVGEMDETAHTERFNMFAEGGMEVGLSCGHQRADFDRYGYEDLHEWTHTNSIVFVPEESAYFLYSKYTDSLIKLARDGKTKRLERIWQIGGRGSEFTFADGSPTWSEEDPSALWNHGHLSHVWSGGFALFDNGDHKLDDTSRLVEYRINEAEKTIEEVYAWADHAGGHTASMGDVRKLPGGNYLAGWSSLGRINEVDPNTGERVWEVQGDLGLVVGRVYPIPDPYQTDLW